MPWPFLSLEGPEIPTTARKGWHEAHGVTDTAGPADTLPWSYNFIFTEHSPEHLQRRLAASVPTLDWTPTPAADFGRGHDPYSWHLVRGAAVDA